MKYETLLTNAIQNVPGFRTRYNEEIKADAIDKQSGMHTVFSFVFVPLFESAIKARTSDIGEFAKFIEQMETCDDINVQEVCEFTVLEELCDCFTDEELYDVLGSEARECCKHIRAYIVGPQ